jgi:acyl-CoA reductase-like NAD-dependent aldehyde dehydrogenase
MVLPTGEASWILARLMDYFADYSNVFRTSELASTDARKSIVIFEPLGVIGSIMPWNFPYWQALRFAALSLMVGNTIVLKPASATMGCRIEIEKTFIRSGAPEGSPNCGFQYRRPTYRFTRR